MKKINTNIPNLLMNWLHILLENFHPLHFVASMGIGITSGIMFNFPIVSIRKGMKYVGIIYFFINLVVLVLNHSLFTLKYVIFPYIYKNDTRYSVTFADLMTKPLIVFMGASQMSLISMINMLYMMKPHWKIAVFVLWWIGFFHSMFCIVYVTFMTFSNPTQLPKIRNHGINDDLEKQLSRKSTNNNRLELVNTNISLSTIGTRSSIFKRKQQQHNVEESQLDKVSPVLLLPIVTSTVTSASGALISNAFNHVSIIIAMIIICTMLCAVAIFAAFVVLGVIFTKLFSYGLPKNNTSFTMFVPIGVMGQGSWAILLISKQLVRVVVESKGGFTNIGLSAIENEELNPVIENLILTFGIFGAISLTSFGILITLWSILSVGYWYVGKARKVLSINKHEDRSFKINSHHVYWTPTMWAATFPLGTIALSTHELYQLTDIIGFKIVSTIYSFSVIVVTTWCMIGTLVYIVPWKKLRSEITIKSEEN